MDNPFPPFPPPLDPEPPPPHAENDAASVRAIAARKRLFLIFFNCPLSISGAVFQLRLPHSFLLCKGGYADSIAKDQAVEVRGAHHLQVHTKDGGTRGGQPLSEPVQGGSAVADTTFSEAGVPLFLRPCA
jgi:hypothetical protein